MSGGEEKLLTGKVGCYHECDASPGDDTHDVKGSEVGAKEIVEVSEAIIEFYDISLIISHRSSIIVRRPAERPGRTLPSST